MQPTVYEGDKPYIFISYAHKDSETVLPLIERLQKSGFRVWYDRGIEVGSNWTEYIAEHLKNARSVIAFVSKASVGSKNCTREIRFASGLDKDILVAYLEDVELSEGLDYLLHGLHAVMRKNSDADEAFVNELCTARLLEPCHGDAPTDETEPQPHPIPEAEPQPAEPDTENAVEAIDIVEQEGKPQKLTKHEIFRIVVAVVVAVVATVISVVAVVKTNERPVSNEVTTWSYIYDELDSDPGSSPFFYEVDHRTADGIVTEVREVFKIDMSYQAEKLKDEKYCKELTDQMVKDQTELLDEGSIAVIESYFEGTSICILHKYSSLDQEDNGKRFLEEHFSSTAFDVCVNPEKGDWRIYIGELNQLFLDCGIVRN